MLINTETDQQDFFNVTEGLFRREIQLTESKCFVMKMLSTSFVSRLFSIDMVVMICNNSLSTILQLGIILI